VSFDLKNPSGHKSTIGSLVSKKGGFLPFCSCPSTSNKEPTNRARHTQAYKGALPFLAFLLPPWLGLAELFWQKTNLNLNKPRNWKNILRRYPTIVLESIFPLFTQLWTSYTNQNYTTNITYVFTVEFHSFDEEP